MTNTAKNPSVVFTTTERLIGVAVICSIALVIAYCYLLWHHSVYLKEAGHEARKQTDSIYTNIAEISGLTSSLRTLYQATADHENDYLEHFTAEQLKVSNIITSIGRFERFKHAETDRFASLMSERGIYHFELKSIAPDGSMALATPRKYHNAIVDLYPFTPATARLIGVDLSFDDTLAKRIDLSAQTNDLVFAPYPHGFPKSGGSLIFVPTYAGRYTPVSIPSRISQFDGGFVLELSILKFLPDSNLVSSRITLPGIALSSGPTTTENQMYFQQLFPGHQTHISPSIGNSAASVEIKSADGVAASAILRAIACAVVWLLFSMAILHLLAKNRRHEWDRRSSEKSLEKERKIALVTLEAINDSVFTLTPEGKISYVNPAAETMVQSESNKLLGRSIAAAIPFARDESSIDSAHKIQSKLHSGKPVTLSDIEIKNKTQKVQVDCTFSPFSEKDSTNGGVLVMRDVGAERALTQKLEHLATHDSLTGLVNRYYFELKLQDLITGVHERGESHAICYIDLDQFKTINDTCGHAAGDKLIKKVGEFLEERCRPEDILARLGGDEFGLLINNCSESDCESIAKYIFDSFQNFYFTSGEHKFAIRACFGFVAINDTYKDIAGVLASADIACYSAKDRGRNELHIFRPECEETSQRHGEMLMLPILQNALAMDKFVLFVQPIAKILESGYDASTKFEILLRMIDDNGRLITPFQLIGAAERYDLMKQVDRWVINRALIEIATLRDIYGPELPMFSINLSGQSVMDSDLIEYIRVKFEETSTPRENICFEITETSAMGDTKRALELIEFLHEQGCKVALDDFGAGECSFGYLKTLPVDYLKVDGQFVKEVDTCEVHKEMLRFAQRVASLLDMKTVAEFVESDSIVDTLREMHIDYAQGYHIGKPFNIEELKTQQPLRRAA